MPTLKRGMALLLCTAAVVAAAGTASSGQRYGHSEKRVHAAQDRSYVVANEGSEVRTPFDYFFNNEEKYKSYRNDPGEYYRGVNRR
ncbi:hypothetical protein [Pararhizobium sp.]|uniref:hypothetical protein n=1 Tax=Pararhizobium sp. TaxID=1977563 RepID=UPI002728C38F|nr:hypothetical protein [Pararhizobium sp.]MDO9414767.1 hypothetical protein [Pararhizobium sp.]